MAKQSKTKKAENLGKGKVTPVQIAFIVDCYLTDKNYTKTLSAFRTEAADLLSKTKGKEVPKGLMGLDDILDEYISLKEQRVMLDGEKQRVETALQGMQDVMRRYFSAGSVPLPPSPPLVPPRLVATPPALAFPNFYPTSESPPGSTVHGSSITSYDQRSMPTLKAAEPNKVSTSAPNALSSNKRKASNSAPKVPPAPKKSHVQCPQDVGGAMLASQVPGTRNTGENGMKGSSVQSKSEIHARTDSPVQGSTVAKSLFGQTADSREYSSPKTPPQALPSPVEKLASSHKSAHMTNACTSQEIESSNCSVISSQTIIVSPLKRVGYYSVERSYHVASSPFRLNQTSASRREQVKGRLNFDSSDVPKNSGKAVAAECTSTSTDEETQEFDFDLPDLDLLSGDFSFSQFLSDIDLDCDGISSHSVSIPPDSFPWSENHLGNVCSDTNQALLSAYPSTLAALSEEDMKIQALDTVTSVRSITKCIVVSPAKTRSKSSLEPTVLPAEA